MPLLRIHAPRVSQTSNINMLSRMKVPIKAAGVVVCAPSPVGHNMEKKGQVDRPSGIHPATWDQKCSIAFLESNGRLPSRHMEAKNMHIEAHGIPWRKDVSSLV